MADETLDVKQDEMEESSSSDTTQKADVNANVSMLDFVKKTVADVKSGDEPTNQDEETKAEESSTTEGTETELSDSQNELDKSEEKEEKSEDKEESEDKSEKEVTETKEEEQRLVPYERFKEANEKVSKYETELAEAKPLIEHQTQIYQYCNANQISQKQFSEGLEVMALINTNPREALVRLNKLVEDLQGFTGNKLPDDLQQRVDTGKLDLDIAKELAMARAEKKWGERSIQQHQLMRQQEQQTALQRGMVTATNSWVESKKNDPDFKAKAKADLPDGKFERVFDKFSAMLNQVDVAGKPVNLVQTPQQMTALLERAYTMVSQSMGSAKGKPATRKILSHNSSSRGNSTRTIEQAKTMREAIAIAAGN